MNAWGKALTPLAGPAKQTVGLSVNIQSRSIPSPTAYRRFIRSSPGRGCLEMDTRSPWQVNSVPTRSHIAQAPHVVATGDFRYGLAGLRDIIRAGTPITVQLLGTSETTKEFALTTTLSPMVTPPITLHPAARKTLLPMVGQPVPRTLATLTP